MSNADHMRGLVSSDPNEESHGREGERGAAIQLTSQGRHKDCQL